MIVYHGSYTEVQHPDVLHSIRALDFGPGFYVTTIREQAETWAKRKVMRLRSGGSEASQTAYKPIVNCYELAEGYNEEPYKCLEFKDADHKWLQFIADCRKNALPNSEWDVISGQVADDKVYQAVGFFLNGIWDAERTLNEVRYYERNDQICFVSQRIIDSKLKFLNSYEVIDND